MIVSIGHDVLLPNYDRRRVSSSIRYTWQLLQKREGGGGCLLVPYDSTSYLRFRRERLLFERNSV